MDSPDTNSNRIGSLGFALGLTTFLLLFSAGAIRQEFPAYLALATCFSVPTILVGLVCSIIGALRSGRPKLFSILGVGLNGFLLLAGLPAAFTAVKTGE
jgi:hypothetical protein